MSRERPNGIQENKGHYRKQESMIKAARQRKKTEKRVFIICCLVVLAVFVLGLFITFQLFGKDKEEELFGKAPTEVSSDNEIAAAMATPQSDYERVINRTYPLPENYIAGTGVLTTVEGVEMESNAAEALKEMVGDLRKNGMSIIVQSGYRTQEEQETLYKDQKARQGNNELKAATISALPLTSEHQAGLAVDLSVNGVLDANFAATPEGKWLENYCTDYGYILRYTKEKMSVTGIIWEPWHFRYVGSAKTAKAITTSGKCMEEYYNQYLEEEDLKPYLPYLK